MHPLTEFDLYVYRQYLKYTARERLKYNITKWHVSEYGPEIEELGTGGEGAARLYLNLPLKLHVKFDGGYDLIYKGLKINVKTTHWTKYYQYRFLQWRETTPIHCDAAIMAVCNLKTWQAKVVGWTWAENIAKAPVNKQRKYPCHEIAIPKLFPMETLLTGSFNRPPSVFVPFTAPNAYHGFAIAAG